MKKIFSSIFPFIVFCSINPSIESPTTKFELRSENGEITSFAISPNEKFLAIGTNRLIQIFSNQGVMIKQIEAHDNIVTDLKFTHDNAYLASCSLDKTVKVWNCRNSFEIFKEFNAHLQPCVAIDFFPDSYILSSASNNGTIKHWNIISNECHIEHFNRPINNIEFSKNKKFLIAGTSISAENTEKIRIIKLDETNRETKHLFGLEDAYISSLKSFKNTNDFLFIINQKDNDIITSVICKFVINSDNGQTIKMKNQINDSEITETLDSLTENLIVCGYKNGKIKIWNLESKEVILNWQAHNCKIKNILFLPINQLIISCDANGYIYAWETTNIS